MTGKVVVHPDRVEFLNCVGVTKAGATVKMNGWSQRDGPLAEGGDPTGQAHLKLDFMALNLPLDETLRSAIPVERRPIWEQLQPEGVVSLTACFDHPPAAGTADVVCSNASQAAITPKSFPYRLHNFDGPIQMSDGAVVEKPHRLPWQRGMAKLARLRPIGGRWRR